LKTISAVFFKFRKRDGTDFDFMIIFKLYQRIAQCLLGGALFIGVAGITTQASAMTLSLSSASPIPTAYDLYNFAGASMDMNNVYLSGSAPATNGPANDGYTYVAHDRATQGQTFTTGSSSGGYLLTDIWVKHVGYTANTADPKTTGSNGTWLPSLPKLARRPGRKAGRPRRPVR
jgi:hypothetical protein